MRKSHATILLVLLSLSISGVAAAFPEDDFNHARLQSGQDLYNQKKYLEAIDEFRIAAFGFLDEPPRVSECLARIALAQAAAGKSADVDVTLLRLLEIEQLFPSYPQAGLQAEIRTGFRVLLLARVPQATLLSIPSLAKLVETEEQKIALLPPKERRKALESALKREPANVIWPLNLSREALDRGDPKDAERWAGNALAIQSTNADALALRVQARMLRGDYAGALKDVADLSSEELDKRPELSADKFVCLVEMRSWDAAATAAGGIAESVKNRSDVASARLKLEKQQLTRGSAATLARTSARTATPAPSTGSPATGTLTGATAARKMSEPPPPDPARSRASLAESSRLISSGKSGEAEKLLTEASKADPANRDLRLALLEAACLSRSYPTGAAQIPLVSPLADSEATSLFYAAAVLYETGHPGEAQTYLQRALPRVSGPLVDEYTGKILGKKK